MEKVRPWCGQPSDRGRLKNRTEETKKVECAMHTFCILCNAYSIYFYFGKIIRSWNFSQLLYCQVSENIFPWNFVGIFAEDDDAAGDVAGSSELANCSYKSDSDPFKKRMALSDFTILKVLGKGSFGKVCRLMLLMLHFTARIPFLDNADGYSC